MYLLIIMVGNRLWVDRWLLLLLATTRSGSVNKPCWTKRGSSCDPKIHWWAKISKVDDIKIEIPRQITNNK
jgi:hypothetical protein